MAAEDDAQEEGGSVSEAEENNELESLEGEVLEPPGGEQGVQEPEGDAQNKNVGQADSEDPETE